MNRKTLVGALLVVSLGIGGLTVAWGGPQKQAAAPESRILGHLELQSKRVTIKSGGKFTVKSKDGRVLAEDVTLQQLKALDPVLQERLERIMAGKPHGVGWAGLDGPRRLPADEGLLLHQR